MKYYLYILKTVSDTLYCGITPDLLKRYKLHLEGKGAKYTKANKPSSIAYADIFDDKSSALKEEYRIKHKLKRSEKIKLIEENKKKTKLILSNIFS